MLNEFVYAWSLMMRMCVRVDAGERWQMMMKDEMNVCEWCCQNLIARKMISQNFMLLCMLAKIRYLKWKTKACGRNCQRHARHDIKIVFA